MGADRLRLHRPIQGPPLQTGHPRLPRLSVPPHYGRLFIPHQSAYARYGCDRLFGEGLMVRYVQTMIRNEPGTFVVMCLMIAILAFGLWDLTHTVKR